MLVFIKLTNKTPPTVRRDVGFTYSVDGKDRSSQTNPKDHNSVATEGLKHYRPMRNYTGKAMKCPKSKPVRYGRRLFSETISRAVSALD